jgi:hypothetical protein
MLALVQASVVCKLLQVLLPLHPGLSRLLMSRQMAIRVLERRADFLERIEAAGNRPGQTL